MGEEKEEAVREEGEAVVVVFETEEGEDAGDGLERDEDEEIALRP